MGFGEKLITLRNNLGLTQNEVAKAVGISVRSYSSYECGQSYPRSRERYQKLADTLHTDINYLLTEDQAFIAKASERYGNRAAQQAASIVKQMGGLFAGGELSEADKDVFMHELEQLYWDAKDKNRKKYTPKKYRKA